MTLRTHRNPEALDRAVMNQDPMPLTTATTTEENRMPVNYVLTCDAIEGQGVTPPDGSYHHRARIESVRIEDGELQVELSLWVLDTKVYDAIQAADHDCAAVHTRTALHKLRQARNDLKAAGSTRALEKVRSAIKSVGGAIRHADSMRTREAMAARRRGK